MGGIGTSKLSLEKMNRMKETWQEAKNTINTRNPHPIATWIYAKKNPF
jgi:hypothetical protein